MHLIHPVIKASIPVLAFSSDLMEEWKTREIKISKASEQRLAYIVHSKTESFSSAQELIEMLKEDPMLSVFFALPSGTKEGISIEDHTLNVCGVAEKYLKTDLAKMALPMSYFQLFLSMHDIGKGVAFNQFLGRAPWREKTTEYTLEIAKKVFTAFSLEEKYQDLFLAVLSKDTIGLYLRGHLSLQVATKEIEELAAKAKLSPREFFSFYELYFKADAASYGTLFRNIFSVHNGRLFHSRANGRKISLLLQNLAVQSKL